MTDRPPDDPNAGSFASPGATWFANDARTLWAWWWGKRFDGSYKVLWVRPSGAALKVTGTRLDGASAPMRVDIAGGGKSFETSGLYFPAAGCWQVEVTSSGASMRVVIRVAN